MSITPLSIPKINIQKEHISVNPYHAALAVWLKGFSDNTQRSYYRSIKDLLDFTSKDPSQIIPLDIARWKEHLKTNGCSKLTIQSRLYAVSSYYRYLQLPQGATGQPVHTFNPVDGVKKKDLTVSLYSRAKKITVKQFQQILSQIDTTTPKGARDKAAFLFYVCCARRRREVSTLRHRDISIEEDKVYYQVQLKGGASRKKEMPPPVWDAIVYYLYIANRELDDDSPIFVASIDTRHLRNSPTHLEDEVPIRGNSLNLALKQYAKKAGFDPKKITLHSLRHLGAELFLEASGDIHETQAFLDHKYLNTTQIYLKQLTGEKHRHWQAMANKLDLK